MHAPRFRAALAATFATVSTLAAISVATPAHAGDQSPITSTATSSGLQSRVVSYADLDLSKAEGVERLRNRVRMAARQVCDVRPGIRPLSEMSASAECYAETLSRAGRAVELAVDATRGGQRMAANGRIAVAARSPAE